MQYKQTMRPTTVIRVDDGAFLAVDHPEYVAWLAAGNTPLPVDPLPPPTAQQTADADALAAFRLGWLLGQARLGRVAVNGIQRQMDTLEAANMTTVAAVVVQLKIVAEAVEDIAGQLQTVKRAVAIQADVPDR